MVAKKEHKLDIFAVMKRLDSGDKATYPTVKRGSPEAAKELDSFFGYPVLRWMSCAGDDADARYCLEAMEIANVGYFSLGKHRELQAKLIAALGARKRLRHEWIAPPKVSSGDKDEDAEAVLTAWPHLKRDEVKLWMKLNGKEGLEELKSRLGLNNKN